jgi:predicted enzyme related to lactoylglutathione lyase
VGSRTSHAPGTFSWVDLATVDAAAAKSFYTGLFGWETEDNDAGGGNVYTVCRLGGAAVCGLYEMTDDMRATGVPPSWTSHVTVAGADDVAARARELGGGAVDGAFDVLDAGRMAVLSDPQGAVFAVWEPRARIGAEHVNDVGCLCMNELATTDMDSARSFYEALFGWTTEMVDTAPSEPPMGLAYNGGTLNASFGALDDGTPPRWRPYFTVEAMEAAVARVRELGGSVAFGPAQIFDGWIAVVLDPQGAELALFEGEVDP